MERKRKKDIEYSRRSDVRAKHYARMVVHNQKYWNEHPEKRSAYIQVMNALSSNRLVKQPCFICGETKVEGHHPDYSAPLDVVWLCHKHHKEAHDCTH